MAITIAGRDGKPGIDALLGVTDDPIEIMLLGTPTLDGGCMDLSGINARHLLAYLLHPEIVVVGAWRRNGDRTRGERLGVSAGWDNARGILPLSHPYPVPGPIHLDLDGAFSTYFTAWSTHSAHDLLEPVIATRYYRPGWLRLTRATAPIVMRIKLTTGGAINHFYTDLRPGSHDLPATFTVPVQRFRQAGTATSGAGCAVLVAVVGAAATWIAATAMPASASIGTRTMGPGKPRGGPLASIGDWMGIPPALVGATAPVVLVAVQVVVGLVIAAILLHAIWRHGPPAWLTSA